MGGVSCLSIFFMLAYIKCYIKCHGESLSLIPPTRRRNRGTRRVHPPPIAQQKTVICTKADLVTFQCLKLVLKLAPNLHALPVRRSNMATKHGAETPPQERMDVGGTNPNAPKATNKDDAKKAINKATATGDALTPNQITRAATEYMTALRPQPAPVDAQSVLLKLVELDDKGELKNKLKDTDAVPGLVDAALAEATKAA